MTMYDQLSADYDRFVNWPGRLAVELPFLLQQIGPPQKPYRETVKVLDSACGTGMHAIAIAGKGYQVAGADLSASMIEQARANAASSGVQVRFEAAGFGELAGRFGAGSFDAVLCLGNSLPHLLTPGALRTALSDFAACLRPGGLLLVQNRNFDLVVAKQERWMEPQSARQGDHEWLFLRFYDFDPGGFLTFNIITLRRRDGDQWSQHLTSTRLWPMRQAELSAALLGAGFVGPSWYGNMSGDPFYPLSSGNLVFTARKFPG